MFKFKNKPPSRPPFFSKNQYTFNGKIPIKYWYFDDTLEADQKIKFTKEQYEFYLKKIRAKEELGYRETDLYLYEAIEKYKIIGKKVAILGSRCPRYEILALHNGASSVTFDYNQIEIPYVNAIFEHIGNISKYKNSFDFIFSISSYEHSGLGRYGDPLDPFGDIKAMQQAFELLSSNGILFLAVPVGQDALIWNAHRIYGRHRLPLLLDGWEILEDYGFYDEILDKENIDLKKFTQPLFVLRKMS